MDHDSIDGSGKEWISYFKSGELSVSPYIILIYSPKVSADLKTFSVTWSDNADVILKNNIAAGGRAMELSDLVVFDHRLLTVDDRTGLLYEVSPIS